MTTLDEYARAGIKAVNEQNFADAIDQFVKALEIDSERPDLNNALGMAYLNRGEVVSALPYLQKAAKLAQVYDQPEHQDMRRHFETGLATAFTLLDRVVEARAVIEQAIAKWPNELDIRLQLGTLLVSSCLVEDGAAVYRAIAEDAQFDDDMREASEALSGAIQVFLDDEDLEASVFLQAHAESYHSFFNQQSNKLVETGWYAEAQRMVRGEDGEPKPMLAEGARHYAMERVDLVNPSDGEIATVYDAKDPMIVAVNGFEPLAQVPVTLPWRGWPFEVWVCSRCPWHWLTLSIQFHNPGTEEQLINIVDELIGSWYLSGFNGDFGDSDSGRFHYVTNPETIGDRAVTYTFDLGRARYDAVPALLNGLTILHDRHPIHRVLIGSGRLPDQ